MKLKKTMNLTKKDEPDSNSKLKIPSGKLKIPINKNIGWSFSVSDGEKSPTHLGMRQHSQMLE